MFKLAREPYMAQITVHFHNYNSHFGEGMFIQHFEEYLEGRKVVPAAMTTLVWHYGKDMIDDFLDNYILVVEPEAV